MSVRKFMRYQFLYKVLFFSVLVNCILLQLASAGTISQINSATLKTEKNLYKENRKEYELVVRDADLGVRLALKNHDQQALPKLIPAADSGDPISQYFIGEIIERNRNNLFISETFIKNKKPISWYKKSAEQGLAKAQSKLCHLYRAGRKHSRDFAKALNLCELAAISGSPHAEYNLGLMFLRGEGVKKDRAKAREWLRKATRKVLEAQEFLLVLGFDPGVADGIAGKKTASAIGEFQFSENLRVDGELTTDSFKVLKEIAQLKIAKTNDLVDDGSSLGTAANIGLVLKKVKQEEASSKELELLKIKERQNRLKIQKLENLLTSLMKKYGNQNDNPQDASSSLSINDNLYRNIKFGTYHALIIGNDDYRYLGKLNTAINDATSVNNLLKQKYGFQTNLLKNATRKEIIKALNGYSKRLSKGDNFLVYYAGHGAFDEATKTGYWQPVDAEVADDTEWIANDRITRILSRLKANNVIVVADSCYSGTIFRGELGDPILTQERKIDVFQRLIEKKTRVALTSGGNKPVPDAVGGSSHSVFANSFIRILRSNAKVLTASRLSNRLKERVIAITRSYNIEQTPEFSNIHKAGHDGGDFLFVPKSMVFRSE